MPYMSFYVDFKTRNCMSPTEVVIFGNFQFGRKVSEQCIQAYIGLHMDWNGIMWYFSALWSHSDLFLSKYTSVPVF